MAQTLPDPSSGPISGGNRSSERIHLIDNFRGAALIGILLLHTVEHFSLYIFPETGPAWLLKLDHLVTHIAFFLFFGKAYAVFALLFGVSYYIQERNNSRKGVPHRERMLRRMGWLFIFGLLHGLFYPGDILCILAIFGALLVLLAGLPSRILLVIAIILSLQPVLLFGALFQGTSPTFASEPMRVQQLIASLRDDHFLRLVVNNAWNNRITEWMLTLTSGRLLQLGAWMMLGIVAARRGYFEDPKGTTRFNTIAVICAVLTYLILAFASRQVEPAWVNVLARWKEAMMVVIYLGSAMLLAAHWQLLRSRTLLATYGKMSLTNYISQGLFGSILFYGYGFGLYRLGGTLSLTVGMVILVIQFLFSRWWAARHKRGPLEELWGRLTSSATGRAVVQTDQVGHGIDR